MKILMSSLPKSDWWGKGTPVYKNNWAMESGRIPDATLARKEHKQVIDSVKKYTQLTIIPFDPLLDTDQVYKHDAVFVRDSFISNQKGKVVISNYSAKERQQETDRIKHLLKNNGYSIFELSENSDAEGGEFYYLKKDNILFAGISRNNKEGILETAKHLEVTEVCIVASNAYHLDTFFTPFLDKKGHLGGIIVCMELVNNKNAIRNFAKKHHIKLYEINSHDAIDFNGKGNITVNCLPLPGVLISGGKFATPGVEEYLKQMEIKHIITPASQFLASGGGIHCLTNELDGSGQFEPF